MISGSITLKNNLVQLTLFPTLPPPHYSSLGVGVCACVYMCMFICVPEHKCILVCMHVEIKESFRFCFLGTPPLFFETGSLTGLELPSRLGWLISDPWGNPPVSTSLSTRMCHLYLACFHGFCRLNSGPPVYKTSTLMTKLSPQPYIQFL